MSDPNLPEGVTQKDIDATVGETFDPNVCEHDELVCDNCGCNHRELINPIFTRVKELEDLLRWFCERVENGEVRSHRTYEKFKQALSPRVGGEVDNA